VKHLVDNITLRTCTGTVELKRLTIGKGVIMNKVDEEKRLIAHIEDDDSSYKPLENIAQETAKERYVKWFSLGTGVAAGVHMIISFIFGQNALQTVSNILAMTTTPICIVNEREMTNIEALKMVDETMKKENEDLLAENQKLKETLDGLKNSTAKFEDGLNALVFITKRQNFNVDDFEVQVEEQKVILARRKKQQESKLVNLFLSVVIKADKNEDYTLGPKEIDQMLQNLDMVPYLKVNKKLFREVIETKGGDLVAVLEVCRNLLGHDENTLDEEKILYFTEEF